MRRPADVAPPVAPRQARSGSRSRWCPRRRPDRRRSGTVRGCRALRGISSRWVTSTVIRSIDTRPTTGQGTSPCHSIARVREHARQPVGIAAAHGGDPAGGARPSRHAVAHGFAGGHVAQSGSPAGRATRPAGPRRRAGRHKGRCRAGSGRSDSPARAGCRRWPRGSAARRCHRSSRGIRPVARRSSDGPGSSAQARWLISSSGPASSRIGATACHSPASMPEPVHAGVELDAEGMTGQRFEMARDLVDRVQHRREVEIVDHLGVARHVARQHGRSAAPARAPGAVRRPLRPRPRRTAAPRPGPARGPRAPRPSP